MLRAWLKKPLLEIGHRTLTRNRTRQCPPALERLEDRITPDHSTWTHVCPVFAPGTPQAYIDAHDDSPASGGIGPMFAADLRWTNTATNPGPLDYGDPTTLTWCIVPDGLFIPGIDGEPDSNSNLIAFLDDIYGGAIEPVVALKPWFGLIQQAFDSWSVASGLTYVYEPNDDRAPFGSSPGFLGVRADVRIGGHFIDGGGSLLAYNGYPSDGGDMVIDTADDFFLTEQSNNSRGLRNLIAHEAGHGLGLGHVYPEDASKVMEPTIDLSYDGPQHDDILGANSLYGDRLEPNDFPATGTDLGPLSGGKTSVADISIDGVSDVDYFRFTVPAGKSVSVTASPVGFTYLSGFDYLLYDEFDSKAQSDLGLQLLAADGTTVLFDAATSDIGLAESFSTDLLPSGPYYLRVWGLDDFAQMYRLSINVAEDVAPRVLELTPAAGATIPGDRVNLDVTFTKPVLSVDANDLVLSGAAAAAATVGLPTNTSGNTWRFPISGLIGGPLSATLGAEENRIEDYAGNDLAPRPTTWSYNVAGDRFANPGEINIRAQGRATPYPSNIMVAGMSGGITQVTVTLSDFEHEWPEDVDILLFGPEGQRLVLMSDTGGIDWAMIRNLTFDDGAEYEVFDYLYNGAFQPTNYELFDAFPAPAPTGAPTGTKLSVFNGTNPNGRWSLYVADDTADLSGSIGGWSLTITTDAPTATATSTSLTATPLASTGGAPVMFTATVTPSPADAGTVTFLDGGNPIPGGSNIALSGGVAVFSTSTLSIGNHPVTAAYSGAPDFLPSTSDAQTVIVSAPQLPPQVVSVAVNGNIASLAGPHRSRVVSLVVVFDQPVQLDANAIALALHTNNVFFGGAEQPGGFGALPASLHLATTDNVAWTVTFVGNTETGADGFHSLKDGVYDLNIDGSSVHPLGMPNISMAAGSTMTFHRLFGDTGVPTTANNVDFTAVVNTGDNLRFRTAFNRPAPDYLAYLDFDGGGIINSGDNLQFRTRFNKSLTWRV